MEEGTFREDLCYRLNVLNLKIPALRERNGDIELLAHTFFEKFAGDKNSVVKGFSQQALYAMETYSWPGNDKPDTKCNDNEQKQADHICRSGLDEPIVSRNLISLDDARDKAKFKVIRRQLQINKNNVSKTARDLGVSRVTLYRLINKLKTVV